MLGLSNGITSVSAPSSRVLLNTYTADFTSDTDGFGDLSHNDTAATFTANQSIGGQDGCLKVISETNESGLWGIRKSSGVFTNPLIGDYVHVTGKIYLDTTGGAWGTLGAGANISIYMAMGSSYDNIAMAQNTWVDFDSEALPAGALDSDLMPGTTGGISIYSIGGGPPAEHAAMFIKDLVVKQYRSQLFT